MEFTHEFVVPSDIETTFATLTDLEKVAPCMPGAVLEEVDGDVYKGRVKVKVGPAQITYRGTATMAEIDRDAKKGRIEAAGRETRGSGTASAKVSAGLSEVAGGTLVTVVTDLDLTGRVAQFGRGVLADIGSSIIDAFADRLRDLLEDGVPPVGSATQQPEPRPATKSPVDDALDLVEIVGGVALKRIAVLAVTAAALMIVVRWLRARS